MQLDLSPYISGFTCVVHAEWLNAQFIVVAQTIVVRKNLLWPPWLTIGGNYVLLLTVFHV